MQNGNAKISREYRRKYPDFPTKKLARIMYAENNLAFAKKLLKLFIYDAVAI